jgi:hypothetical protein
MNDPQKNIDMQLIDYISEYMQPHVYRDPNKNDIDIQDIGTRDTIFATAWTLQYIGKLISRKEIIDIFAEPRDHIFALNEAMRILYDPTHKCKMPDKIRKNRRYYNRLADMIINTYNRIITATNKTDIENMKTGAYKKAEYTYLEAHSGKNL